MLDNVHGRGQYVGTYLALTTLERYWWGEGEMKFYIDGDEEYPHHLRHGHRGLLWRAWSFATRWTARPWSRPTATPFLGYPFYSRHDTTVHNNYHNDDCPPCGAFTAGTSRIPST